MTLEKSSKPLCKGKEARETNLSGKKNLKFKSYKNHPVGGGEMAQLLRAPDGLVGDPDFTPSTHNSSSRGSNTLF